ncbi:MAG: ribonuclease III domain-containing protein [Alphaproteobacteria bacterium]
MTHPVIKRLEGLTKFLGLTLINPLWWWRATNPPTDGMAEEDTYQRLEFKGDKILPLVVHEILVKHLEPDNKNVHEALNALNLKLNRNDVLRRIFELAELDAYYTPEPINRPHAPSEDKQKADVVEALICAAYEDNGKAIPPAVVVLENLLDKCRVSLGFATIREVLEYLLVNSNLHPQLAEHPCFVRHGMIPAITHEKSKGSSHVTLAIKVGETTFAAYGSDRFFVPALVQARNQLIGDIQRHLAFATEPLCPAE